MKGRKSVFRDVFHQPYDDKTRIKLYNSSKGSLDLIQRLRLLKSLPVHNGCVNSICWNETGEYILSGSDDQHLVVTHGYNYKVLTDLKTSHRANIFSAKFLPSSGDTSIISCSGDGIILYTDLTRKQETFYNQFNCHSGTTYEVVTVPNDPHSFLSCGEDGTVRWFDLRLKDRCNKPQCKEDVLISCQRAVTALSVNPVAPYQLAIGCSDSTVRMFDRRTLGTKASGWTDTGSSLRPLCSFTVPGLENRSFRITSLCFSPAGEDVLVSYSSDHLYLFCVKEQGGSTLKSTPPCSEKGKKPIQRSPPPVRRLRLRGDWSDTGPDARPEREGGRRGAEVAQARPTLHATLMQRMTDVLSRMLNDPATRAALSGGGEDSLEGGAGEPAERRFSALSLDPAQPDSSSAAGASSPTPSGQEGSSSAATPAETEEPQPSDSTSSEEAPDAALLQNKISNLQDQLTCMRDGFIERHGVEPAVRLVYSDKSSSSGTISLGVGDELARERSPTTTVESNGTEEQMDSTVSEADKDNRVSEGPTEPDGAVPGPSRVQDDIPADGQPQAFADGEDEYNDSDDDDLLLNASRRFVHPIEDHMDEAVNAIRNAKEDAFDECSIPQPSIKKKFTGHRNARTMIKEATFWGEDYVLSGSDCGHVFIWDRLTGSLVMLLEADHHVVNCLQPHPVLPVLATSGIDYDVKLWAPLREEASFDAELAETLTKRNEIMLEETKDTITVPASFMIRMLACLNQIRRGGRNRARSRRNNGDDNTN
ncbi:DDB1- and CUL4-associated factor 6-like isoform X1 [Schistocerca cancellata]|uniref:DDB1- and CUL4-associated factor 6-like isoform X1 n=1 Tax=Schistocerca cancellata TaxID=274614 RepID=UPI002119436F|nr:DDB1- and CUL4-associated factor 6-like isoform X1 [Schistocerca cancellata]